MSIRPFLIRRSRAAPTKKEKGGATAENKAASCEARASHSLLSMVTLPILFKESVTEVRPLTEFLPNTSMFGSFYAQTFPFFSASSL